MMRCSSEVIVPVEVDAKDGWSALWRENMALLRVICCTLSEWRYD